MDFGEHEPSKLSNCRDPDRTTLSIVEELMGLPSSVIIGSRGFGIHTYMSDYDICVLDTELPEYYWEKYTFKEAKEYLYVVPLNNSSLIRIPKSDNEQGIDILIYTNKSDIDIINKSLDEMTQIPKYLLENKKIRVVLFEEILIANGFTRVKE